MLVVSVFQRHGPQRDPKIETKNQNKNRNKNMKPAIGLRTILLITCYTLIAHNSTELHKVQAVNLSIGVNK